MKLLRALFSMFRRPARANDGYEAEVQFASWVDLPPQLRVQKPERAAEPEIASSAQVLLPAAPTLQ